LARRALNFSPFHPKDDGLDHCCGGTGTLHCDCGGDFCVCHHHGSIDCDGCEDCEADEDDDYEGMESDYYDELGNRDSYAEDDE
jgi:hypothetical protein